MRVRCLARILAVTVSLTFLIACTPEKDLDQKEKDFVQLMDGVELKGRSTRLGSEKVAEGEVYRINGARKLGGSKWILEAVVTLGGRSIPVPVPLDVHWAGDTPVLALEETTLPGLGTYSARLVIHDGQYAGVWSGGDEGGQLFGIVSRVPK